jgi:hypothetical protein
MSEPADDLIELTELIDDAGGTDQVFPPLDGTAFYSLVCKINHSCRPNVMVRYSIGSGIVSESASAEGG